VVAAGESYEHTNTREVEEEMGITGVEMSHLFTFFYQDERSVTRGVDLAQLS
jgi:NADH pyrophosphatase NudC (nudix superfamily)